MGREQALIMFSQKCSTASSSIQRGRSSKTPDMTHISENEQGKWRNPELEQIRNDVLSTVKQNHEEEAEELANILATIHAAYLFHSKGRAALKAICTVISSTPSSSTYYASWKDLAAALDFSFYQIGCIQNYNHSDYTECILMAYALKENATLGNIVEKLASLQRYDAISASNEHLKELYQVAINEEYKCQDVSKSVSEVTSDNTSILKPDGYKKLYSQVLITLKDLDTEDISKKEKTKPHQMNERIENEIQTSAVLRAPSKKRKCKCNVMLTFAEDGKNIASKITQILRKGTEKRPPIGVLVLEEHREKVMVNPEQFIMHYFDQMNYIFPILTKGYFEELGKTETTNHSALASLDPQYIQYIHDLISKYYSGNNCRNKKIRCLLPRSQAKLVLNHPHMRIDPALKTFVYDDEIEDLAKRLLQIYD